MSFPSQTILLRCALIGNALFSGISGLILLGFSQSLFEALGWPAPLMLQIIGGGLILFAVELILQAMRERMPAWRALLASLADFGWVLGSMVVLLWQPALFSPIGAGMVAGVALVVAGFGIAQLIGIHRLFHQPEGGQYRHCLEIY